MNIATVPFKTIGRGGRPDGEGSVQVHQDPGVKIGTPQPA